MSSRRSLLQSRCHVLGLCLCVCSLYVCSLLWGSTAASAPRVVALREGRERVGGFPPYGGRGISYIYIPIVHGRILPLISLHYDLRNPEK